MEKITPTDAELKNGWTAESLTKYIKEHEKDGQGLIDMTSDQRKTRPSTQNNKYSPLRWRD